MSGENMRNTLVPLVLRLALGVIFVYHGLQKVSDRNAWGAAWTVNFWSEQERMPADVEAKLDAIEEQAKERQKSKGKERDRSKGKEKASDKGKGKAKEAGDRQDQTERLTPMQVAAVRASLSTKYAAARERAPDTLRWHGVQLAVAWGELIGGLALLLGLLTRAAAAGLIIIQLGAIYMVTYAKSFSFAAGGGYEYNVALIAMCLALLLGGAGLLSVDSLTRRKPGAHAHRSPTAPTEPAAARV